MPTPPRCCSSRWGSTGPSGGADGAGHTLTYCCFDSTSRHFARFGQLYLPSDGLVAGQGTSPPDDWDASEFLGPILASAEG
jgi:hypothetical protein